MKEPPSDPRPVLLHTGIPEEVKPEGDWLECLSESDATEILRFLIKELRLEAEQPPSGESKYAHDVLLDVDHFRDVLAETPKT